MKRLIPVIIATALLFYSGLISVEDSSAEVITNDAYTAVAAGWFSMDLTNSPVSRSCWWFINYPSSNSMHLLPTDSASGDWLFSCKSGAVINHQFAQTNTILCNTTNRLNPLDFSEGTNIYVAWYFERDNLDGPSEYDNYGWALLTLETNNYEYGNMHKPMVYAAASATCRGGGIVAGTTTLVPSPATLDLKTTNDLSITGTQAGKYLIQTADSPDADHWTTISNLTLSTPTNFLKLPNSHNPWGIIRSAGTTTAN